MGTHTLFPILLLAAVGLRVVHFAFRGALWGDESALAMNIAPKSIGELGDPYVFTQICPWGYLFVTKLVTLVLGDGERALRSFSLLSGLSIPPLVYLGASRAIDRRAALVALALVAISPALIYFSAELKPYATDAAVTALVLALVAMILAAPDDPRPRVALIIFGLIAVWISLPAIFLLGGACAALLFEESRSRRCPRHLIGFAVVGLLWCAGFFLHLELFLAQSPASSQGVNAFWADGFMPFPPSSFAELRWAPAKLLYAFVDPGGLGLRYLAGACFLLGLFAIAKRNASFLIAMLVPLLLLLVASALGRYPVRGRLLLFIVPILMIGIGASVSFLFERARAFGVAGLCAVALCSASAVKRSAAELVPPDGPDIADFARRLEAEVAPEDGVFLDDSVQWTWLYYGWKHRLAAPPIDTSKIPPDDFFELGKPQAYLQQLAPLFGKKRVWVVLSDFAKPGRGATFDDYYTHYLESHGGRLVESVRGRGFLFALYDLSEAKP